MEYRAVHLQESGENGSALVGATTLADRVDKKLVRESVCLFNTDARAQVMPLTQASVPQVSVSSQEHPAVLDSRKWLTSLVVHSTVDRFLLCQHSILSRLLAVILRKLDFGTTGAPGLLAVPLVEDVEHRLEAEHAHQLHTVALAQEI